MTAAYAFLAALAATPLVRLLARRYGLVARPKADRWHRRPTALLGGVAVFAATLPAILAYGQPPAPFPALGVAAVAVFFVGLADDLVALRPVTKLSLLIAAASVAVWGGVSLGWTDWAAVDSLLTIFWLIGITNAFNLIDNMDGACAGVGTIAAAAVAAISLFTPAAAAGVGVAWASGLGGALLGFLVFNFHPASIFLGDSGSLFIGFLLAGIGCVASDAVGSARYWLGAAPVLVLAVPIFDTTLVTFARKLSGRPASVGGTDHTAHRLVRLGFSETRAVLVLYALSALSGIAAVALVAGSSGFDLLAVGLALALALLAMALLGVRVYGGEDFSLVVKGRLRSLIIDFLARFHTFEVLLDLVLVAAAYYVSYTLRFESSTLAFFFPTFVKTLPIVIASHILSLLVTGAYGRLWRYFSVTDLVSLAKGVALGSGLSILLLVYLYRFENLSRGVLLINAVLLTTLLVLSRAVFRILPALGGGELTSLPRALVYGAGDAGEMLVRELSGNVQYGYQVVGFIDDDPWKAGKRVRGVTILGGREVFEKMLSEAPPEAVILSTGRIDAETIEAVSDACTRAGVPLFRFSYALSEVRDPRVARVRQAQGPDAAGAPRHTPGELT